MVSGFFFVVNPTAAGGRAEKTWIKEVKPLLDENNLEFEYEITTHKGHAIEIAKTRVDDGYRVICAVGGDGTSNEVINGVIKAERPGVFAAFPIGTGNDIPTAFGIPEDGIESMVDCLINGQDRLFDVGYCENVDRYFGGVASMGFDAEVAERSQHKKRFLGRWNYELAILKTLLKFKPYELLIRIDGEQTIEGQRMLLAIGNGKRYGGGMHVCPGAEINDGKFYAGSLEKVGRFTLLRIISTLYDGKHVNHKKVITFEGSRIKVESPEKECLYQVDGEIMGYLPETFITQPNHLTVRVPDPWVSYSEIWEQKLADKGKK